VIGAYWIRDCRIRVGDWVETFDNLRPEHLAERSTRLEQEALSSPYSDKPVWTIDSSRLKVGTHPVELHAVLHFNFPSFQREIEVSKELEVLPADAPVVSRWINDPDLADAFRKALRINANIHSPAVAGEMGLFTATVMLNGRPPMNAAFDFVCRMGDGESNIGKFAIVGGHQVGPRIFQWPIDLEGVQSIVPVLRTSAEAAKAFPDIGESWSGEIVFDAIDVP
jgi:hypothetical protein